MICILQARISSKRLPKKVLKKINNRSILERVINRLKRSKEIKKIIVATSVSVDDNSIVNFCKKNKISYYKSNLNNVFLRYYETIKSYNIRNFVRITADSPLIDPEIIDKAIRLFKKNKVDIVTNTFRRSYPKGQSVEIINSNLILNNLHNVSKSRSYKEHITSYFYANEKKFKIYNFSLKKNLSSINLSVDTLSDFDFVKKIIKLSNDRYIGLNMLINTYNRIKKL